MSTTENASAIIPDWFIRLGYCALTVIIVLFLGTLLVGLMFLMGATLKDWLEERRNNRRIRK